jgi:hypothetical protein
MMRRLDAAAVVFGGVLTIYITQGRYTREAIKGMAALLAAADVAADFRSARGCKSRFWRTQEMSREDS